MHQQEEWRLQAAASACSMIICTGCQQLLLTARRIAAAARHHTRVVGQGTLHVCVERGSAIWAGGQQMHECGWQVVEVDLFTRSVCIRAVWVLHQSSMTVH